MSVRHTAPARRHAVRAGRHRSNRPRTLHLIDLENLVAGQITPEACTAAWQEYCRRLDVRWDDHVIVAVSEKNALTAFLALPGTVQRVVGSNRRDGADRALIDAVELGWAQTRFRQVVIASGDHIFAPLANKLTVGGLFVVQAIGGSWTSTELYLACQAQYYLQDLQRRFQQRLAVVPN
ncbi:NYN domain-containing protein [Nocardia farcinica]|uniref:NYN domain-containing protein n=1 Tax=Nocardia farcinica TaxID=37329 RepID=UPI002455CFB5|nr:NYN domain-containing protein [Nocardia farcinica]